MQAADPLSVIIVGAGFSGLYASYRLRELGFSFRVFEAGDDVGGTWYWNRYPGARCDVASLDYSYSFSRDLEQDWAWSERYATQPEILRYANHVADRFDLRGAISFNTRVVKAQWNADEALWQVETDAGETVSARYLMLAPGALSKPNTPSYPGLDRFAGPIYNTATWPKEGVDFTGRTVGLVGTGSSGIQTMPVVAAQAKDLTVFQRTPVYAMPAGNRPIAADEYAERKRQYPEIREANRHTGFGVVPPASEGPSALAVDADARTRVFEQRWTSGGLTDLVTAYDDLLTDIDANDLLCEFVRGKIRAIVKDPETAAALCPDSFPIGTKRPCLATGYYEAYNQPNVHLVSLRKTPIVEITETGVRTSDADYPVDALILATGFDAVSGAFLAIDVRGKDGISLKEKWAEGTRSYLGVAVAGFPNMFTITGPGSPSVFSNMIVSIEQHIDWVTDYMVKLRAEGVTVAEVLQSAEDEWVAHVAEVADMTLFPRADSWYMGSNIPGKPRMLMAYIGGVGPYRAICDDVAAKGYPGFQTSQAVIPA